MAKRKYDQEFMKTPEGKRIYTAWRNIGRSGRCPEWDDFAVFAEWAINNGYDDEAVLRRHDRWNAHGPSNSYYVIPDGENEYYLDSGWANLWNKTVNRIRVHYGMEPLEVET